MGLYPGGLKTGGETNCQLQLLLIYVTRVDVVFGWFKSKLCVSFVTIIPPKKLLCQQVDTQICFVFPPYFKQLPEYYSFVAIYKQTRNCLVRYFAKIAGVRLW